MAAYAIPADRVCQASRGKAELVGSVLGASGTAGPIDLSRLRGDQDSAREVLVAEFGRIRDLLNRARQLAAVFEMQDEISSMVSQVAGLRERVMNIPEQRM